MQTKIAVISDIHANADALVTVVEELKSKDIDLTICLGDILTYGCQPLEVISILSKYEKENPVIFIKGNHDQIYFDFQSGVEALSYKLPKYIEESVNWTLNKISPLLLEDVFTWCEHYYIGNVYFSHANPFKYGDWSYIEKISPQIFLRIIDSYSIIIIESSIENFLYFSPYEDTRIGVLSKLLP